MICCYNVTKQCLGQGLTRSILARDLIKWRSHLTASWPRLVPRLVFHGGEMRHPDVAEFVSLCALAYLCLHLAVWVAKGAPLF